MPKSHTQALLWLHSAVLLFALSGLFAKWLVLPAVIITFGRAIFAAVSLALYSKVSQQPLALNSKKLYWVFFWVGGLLALHWSSFFLAIQYANVSIGLLTFASFPIFVAIAEPKLFHEAAKPHTLLQALLIVTAIILIVPPQKMLGDLGLGVLAGIFSAMSFAALTLFNRKFIHQIKATQVAFYQNGFACCWLLPLLFVYPVKLQVDQILVLMLLGVVFTAFAHSLFNACLAKLSAHTASMAVSIEPLYGILAAYVLLHEPLTLSIMLGGSIIIAVNIWCAATVNQANIKMKDE